jgi:hypothetical protein
VVFFGLFYAFLAVFTQVLAFLCIDYNFRYGQFLQLVYKRRSQMIKTLTETQSKQISELNRLYVMDSPGCDYNPSETLTHLLEGCFDSMGWHSNPKEFHLNPNDEVAGSV